MARRDTRSNSQDTVGPGLAAESPLSVPDGLSRLDIVRRLTGDFGQRLEILPWWKDAFTALDNPQYRAVLLSLVRQAGKTQVLAGMGVSELFQPGAFVIYVAASEQQAASIYARKIRRPLEKLLKHLGLDRRRLGLTKRGVEVLDLGSALEVIPTSEVSAPGRSPSLVLLDECRDVPDPIFEALAPSVIGAGGKLVLASSAGRPAGFFYQLLQNPAEDLWIYRSTENLNPHAHQPTLRFLQRAFSFLSPSARRRELENEFAEDGDSFLPPALIDAAVDDRLGEIPHHDAPAFAFLDLSRKRDLTSLVVVLRDAPRRSEAEDHLVTASVQVWHPQESPTKEVEFADVRAAVARLPARFPNLETVLVDEGAEAGSVLPWAKTHPALTLRITGFVATPEANMKLWSALAARLHAGTLSIPRHERLLMELRNLKQELFTFGSKWRVVDASRKFHRDVSLALGGAVFAADDRKQPPLSFGAVGPGSDAAAQKIREELDQEAHARANVSTWSSEELHAARWWRR